MARKIRGTCEIALSREDLTEALRLWFDAMTFGGEFRIGKFTMHPDAKFVMRVAIEPHSARQIKETREAQSDSPPIPPGAVAVTRTNN